MNANAWLHCTSIFLPPLLPLFPPSAPEVTQRPKRKAAPAKMSVKSGNQGLKESARKKKRLEAKACPLAPSHVPPPDKPSPPVLVPSPQAARKAKKTAKQLKAEAKAQRMAAKTELKVHIGFERPHMYGSKEGRIEGRWRCMNVYLSKLALLGKKTACRIHTGISWVYERGWLISPS